MFKFDELKDAVLVASNIVGTDSSTVELATESSDASAQHVYTIEEQAALNMLAQNFEEIREDTERRRQDNAT